MNAPTGGASAPAIADFIALNEEIAALVAARIPLESHLAAIGAELPGKAGDLARRIGRRLGAGEDIAAAIDAECAALPASYRAVIAAGVESGQLGSAIESVVASATRLDQLRRVTGVAILYPLMVIVVACCLLALVLTSVVPRFEWLNQYEFGPVAWLAHWPLTVPLLALAVPALVMLAAALWWWRAGRLGANGGMPFGRTCWLPGTRAIRRWAQVATFSELLLMLVERGLPLDRALRLASEAADHPRLRGAAERLAQQLQQGASVGLAGASAEPHLAEFPLLVRLALRHSDDRTLLTGALRQAVTMYHERALRAAEWYAEFLPIVLTVAVGGTVTIAFALFVFWPYASTLHELSHFNWR
jgi:general secretion pathway protein F